MTIADDQHLLSIALDYARRSLDPDTKVGSLLVNPSSGRVLSAGCNGFPTGIAVTPARLADRELKLRLTVHAEINAILALNRYNTRSTKGCLLYTACTDATGEIWGGPPCTRCTVEVIQAGIVEVVTFPTKLASKWRDDLAFALMLLNEAGVSYREVPVP